VSEWCVDLEKGKNGMPARVAGRGGSGIWGGLNAADPYRDFKAAFNFVGTSSGRHADVGLRLARVPVDRAIVKPKE